MSEFPSFPFLTDAAKLFERFKVPGADMGALVASQKRNIDALTRANQLAIEGLQTVARRQAEIVRAGFEEASALMRELTQTKTPEDHVARQTGAAKKALEQSLVNARELSEIVTRASNEAFDVLNQRLGESLDEARDLITRKPG